MNEKALKTLEYDKIINMLVSYASSELGRKKCETLLPIIDYDTIISEQKETSDAVNRIRLKGSTNFGNAKDIYASLKRLEMGSPLSIIELLNVGKLLSNVSKVKGYGYHEEDENFDSLEHYFRELDPILVIEKEISKCIISEDMIADSASSELSRIRRQQKNITSKMHSELNTILNAHREYLMDNVITMRNGSYCLPVKSEFKNKVQGIVHDQSATGSTFFIEPLAVIRMNNELRELEIKEKKEIEIILERLSNMVSPYTEVIRLNLKFLSHLDFVFAKAHLSKAMSASEPIFNKNKYINIKDGRHPLLDSKEVVPINISLGDTYDLLIVTGPNTGGKTVSLKTIGLFTLMGQSGLHIPAFESSQLSVFDEVFADIGDEQSIEQSLSTFSGHMTKIVDILEKADSNSLCLFDELGAGTDPTEGAALAISILSFLHRMKTRTVATTHYSELKVFALSTPMVENASCEFDIQTLRPTYRILIGVPGKSNAFAISRKLGLSEHIIEEAKTHLETDAKSFEDLLVKLENDRIIIEKERLEIEKYKREAERFKSYYQNQNKRLEETKEKIIENAKKEAEDILSKAKQTADTTINNINKIASGAGLGSALEKERDTLRTSIKSLEKPKKEVEKTKTDKKLKLKLGDTVRILSMNTTGDVVTLPNEKGTFYVQMGILRSQVNLSDVELVSENNTAKKTPPSFSSQRSSSLMKSANISYEINVIGMNVDEACFELDKYLDDALLAHLEYVRIIHGRGTGALQKGIHAYLKQQKFIKSYKFAEFDDGGNAVTIVRF
jgi:mutS2 family protein